MYCDLIAQPDSKIIYYSRIRIDVDINSATLLNLLNQNIDIKFETFISNLIIMLGEPNTYIET